MVKLASLLYFAPLVLAGPYDHEVAERSPLEVRQKQDTPLVRRHDYVENTGANVNVNVTVPINDRASSGHSLDIRIPNTGLVASAWSKGGGDGQTIRKGFFAGRTAGRGTRNEIYGTARYGSGYGKYNQFVSGGYQYEPDYTLNITGRDFPHGFPPINWKIYGGSESMRGVDDSDLPGVGPKSQLMDDGPPGMSGALMGFLAAKDNQTWFVMADGQTALFLHELLQLPVEQGGCSIRGYECYQLTMSMMYTANQTGSVDDYTALVYSTVVWPLREFLFHPWNVLQYYRGSSVALGSPLYTNMTYDNAFSHNNNSNADYWSSSPMNATVVDMDFLNCLNTTIAAAIPIINPSLIVHSRLTPGQIAGAVLGPIGGVCLLVALAWLIRRYRLQRKVHNATIAGRSRTFLVRGKETGIAEMPDTDSTIGDEDRHSMSR